MEEPAWMDWIKYEDQRDRANEGERTAFANDIAEILVANTGSIDGALKKYGMFYSHLENNVRNIYELSNHEIPLTMLHELLTNEWNDYDFEHEGEYADAIAYCRAVCRKWYLGVKLTDSDLDDTGWTYREKCQFTGIPVWEKGAFLFYPIDTMNEKTKQLYHYIKEDTVGIARFCGGEFSMFASPIVTLAQLDLFYNAFNFRNE